MEEKELIDSMMMNMLKILSAIFDENGGKIVISADALDNAETRFFLKGSSDGNKFTFTKENGESDLYKDFKTKNN